MEVSYTTLSLFQNWRTCTLQHFAIVIFQIRELLNFVILYPKRNVKDDDTFCYLDTCNCGRDDHDSCIWLFGWCCSDNNRLKDTLKKKKN